MGEEEAWRMFGMPIKASECQAWFEACRDDLFCSCHGDAPCRESWMTPGSFFSFPELDCTEESGECIKFSEIYNGPKDFCEQIYDFAFKYEEDEEAAYSFVGGPEVNEAVDHSDAFPENTCNPNATASDSLRRLSGQAPRAIILISFAIIVPEHFHCSIRVTGVLPLNCYLCTLVLLL